MASAEYLLGLWDRADFMLKAAKALESDLRDDLCSELLADNPNATGTFNMMVGNREVCVSVTESISIDEAEYDMNKLDLTDAEKEAVVFKPSIVKSKFNKLPSECILARDCVIKKPGKPSVKIIS